MLTSAPSASSLALISSASALETPSFTTFGALSTSSLASFSPRPVISRTTLITLTLEEPADTSSTSNSSFSSAAAAPSPPAAAGVVVAAAGGDGAGAAEEKTEFDVELTEVGPNKVKVIKVVRELTGLGLKEAKAVVDEAPKMVKEGADKAEAEDIKAKLEAEGAKVTLK